MDKIKTLTEFFDTFATEVDCVYYLYEQRTQKGWICPKCGAASPSLLLSRRKIQCTHCSHQQALSAGTVM
ncbi:MAG: transposase, partial [Raoultibacter sp.]